MKVFLLIPNVIAPQVDPQCSDRQCIWQKFEETLDKLGANQSDCRAHFIVLNIIVALRGLLLFKCYSSPESLAREWNDNQPHSCDKEALTQPM